MRARLYSALDQQIRDDLATIEKVYREETGDLGELAHRMGITLFQVAEAARSCTRRPAGRRAGRHRIVLERLRTPPIASPRLGTRRPCSRPSGRSASSWRSAFPAPSAWRSGVATSSRAGCSHPWAPWRRRRARSTAESLTERLPVENPRDEFGQLASVFNEHASRASRRRSSSFGDSPRTPRTSSARRSPRSAASARWRCSDR